MEKSLRFLLPATIFVVPLIPAGFGFGYESGKVLVFLVLNIISGFIFIHLLSKKRVVIRWTALEIFGLLFLFILAITTIIGIDVVGSLMGRFPYYQGLILYGFLFLYFLMVAEIRLNMSVLSRAITVSALIVALVAIGQYLASNVLGLPVPNYAGRVISTFGQPNFYSGFLLLVLPFIYYLISKSGKASGWYLVVFLICNLAIMLSFSRIAIFLNVVFIGFLVLKFLPKISRVLFLMLIGLLIVLGTRMFFGEISGLVYREVIEPRSSLWLLNNSPEKRVLIWPVIFEVVLQRSYFGYGLDNLGLAFSGFLSRFDPTGTVLKPEIFTLKSLVLDRAHNYFLDLMVFSGVFGLVFYLVFILLLVLRLFRSITLFSVIILYLIWVQFQNQSLVHLMMFWLIAGIVDNKKDLKDDDW